MKFLIIFFVLISLGITKAQIGINIDKPFTNTLLHIDPNRNSVASSSASQTDDVVITNEGNLGLGITNPSSNLTINGCIKITDGSQATAKILVAKSPNGLAHWQQDSLKNVISILDINFTYSISTITAGLAYDVKPKASPTIINNIVGASYDSSTGIVSLPSGFYNICFAGIYASTFNIFSTKMYIDGNIFLENFIYTGFLGLETFYESDTPFTLNFTYTWCTTPNSNTPQPSGFSPIIPTNIVIEKLSF